MKPALVERPASALTHQGAAEVFDLAEKGPVLIKRRGRQPDEVLLKYEAYEGTVLFLQNLHLISRALVKGLEHMPDLEGMHWTKLFSISDRRRMLQELLESSRAAIERKDPSIFNRVWKGWAHSAELMNDGEAMAALTKPLNQAATVRSRGPSGATCHQAATASQRSAGSGPAPIHHPRRR